MLYNIKDEIEKLQNLHKEIMSLYDDFFSRMNKSLITDFFSGTPVKKEHDNYDEWRSGIKKRVECGTATPKEQKLNELFSEIEEIKKDTDLPTKKDISKWSNFNFKKNDNDILVCKTKKQESIARLKEALRRDVEQADKDCENNKEKLCDLVRPKTKDLITAYDTCKKILKGEHKGEYVTEEDKVTATMVKSAINELCNEIRKYIRSKRWKEFTKKLPVSISRMAQNALLIKVILFTFGHSKHYSQILLGNTFPDRRFAMMVDDMELSWEVSCAAKVLASYFGNIIQGREESEMKRIQIHDHSDMMCIRRWSTKVGNSYVEVSFETTAGSDLVDMKISIENEYGEEKNFYLSAGNVKFETVFKNILKSANYLEDSVLAAI